MTPFLEPCLPWMIEFLPETLDGQGETARSPDRLQVLSWLLSDLEGTSGDVTTPPSKSSFGRKHRGSRVLIRPHFLMKSRIRDIQMTIMTRTMTASSVLTMAWSLPLIWGEPGLSFILMLPCFFKNREEGSVEEKESFIVVFTLDFSPETSIPHQ